MVKDVSNLLIPRRQLMIDYPNSGHKPNAIIGVSSLTERYPLLYRRVEWWEFRTEEEMPEYVITHDEKLIKVDRWRYLGTPYPCAESSDHSYRIDFIREPVHAPVECNIS